MILLGFNATRCAKQAERIFFVHFFGGFMKPPKNVFSFPVIAIFCIPQKVLGWPDAMCWMGRVKIFV